MNAVAQVVCTIVETVQVFAGQVDAAGSSVFAEVAEDVRQLERNPGRLGMRFGTRIVEPPNVDARQPHGGGNSIAVRIQVREGGEVGRVEVHLHAVEDGFEIRRRHVKPLDRMPQRRIERMRITAGERIAELPAPVGKAPPLDFVTAGPIREIVGHAHEGVQGTHGPALFAG